MSNSTDIRAQTPAKSSVSKAERFKRNLTVAVIYFILIVTAIGVLYPLYFVLIGSLNPGNTLFTSTLLPAHLTFKHYLDLIHTNDGETNFVQWYKNTLFVAVCNMILSSFLVVTTAYAFSRFRFPGRRQGLMTMLVLQMFPGFMGMIAIYILLLQMHLLNNLWGLILVYAGGSIPFGAWLVKGYFDGLPHGLEEAARIDGASNTTIFFRIIVPLSVPILSFVAVTNFIGPWMDFIFARLVLRDNDKLTMAIGLFNMVSGRENTNFTEFAAGAVLVSVPITLLFLFLQRYIIEGLTAGANKG